MLRNGVRPSSYTFPPVVKSCRVLSVARFGECVHGQVLRNGFGLHLHVQTAMVDFYSSLGMVVDAGKVFDEMSERDGFAWSTMVSAHARGGDLDSARRVFDEMPEKNTAAWNTMIHGYAEAGDVKSAEVLFRTMLERDVISWTTMINCYCKQELYQEALQLFEEMNSTGTRPDDMTMATVISACAHLGALDKGKEMHLYVLQTKPNIDVYLGSALIDMYAKCGVVARLWLGKRRFCEMTSRYGICPEIEHYSCMIDLLSRVGLLEEALLFIKSMKMQPNSVIWGALLGGCKLHKNLEIAQIAVDRLMILVPNNSGYYTLLINMYAEANRWNEVARIRGIMKECGVEKMLPGSSWIEVKKKMHQFAACDNHHPSLKQIYQLLDMLDSQLKLFGYVPHFDLVM